jgi:hypothetical protein
MMEKGQYVLAFGVIASMLLIVNFPALVIFFFAIFAYLLLKMFSVAGRSETRDIFEFYLSANEILRDDDRRWFGFEIQEAIARGESITQRMGGAPPLVGFALGALYNKIGNHKMAATALSKAIEGENSDERSYLHPSPELRNYVRVLRKIEREPGDAPLTSAAVRSLERARKLRAKSMLEESRAAVDASAAIAAAEEAQKQQMPLLAELKSVTDPAENGNVNGKERGQQEPERLSVTAEGPRERNVDRKRPGPKTKEEQYSNRKPISEVLHDIYDGNVR